MEEKVYLTLKQVLFEFMLNGDKPILLLIFKDYKQTKKHIDHLFKEFDIRNKNDFSCFYSEDFINILDDFNPNSKSEFMFKMFDYIGIKYPDNQVITLVKKNTNELSMYYVDNSRDLPRYKNYHIYVEELDNGFIDYSNEESLTVINGLLYEKGVKIDFTWSLS